LRSAADRSATRAHAWMSLWDWLLSPDDEPVNEVGTPDLTSDAPVATELGLGNPTQPPNEHSPSAVRIAT
jgi:hypothetical protein